MRRLLDVVGTAGVYYAAAHAGLFLAVPGTNVSPVWPATGIALALAVLRGPHIAVGVFLGEFIANTQVFLSDGSTWAAAIGVSTGFGLGNAAEVLAGAWLYQRWVATLHPTRSLRTTWALLRTSSVMCLLSAGAGIGTLAVAGLLPLAAAPGAALTWWLGNMAGVALFTPLILELRKPGAVSISPMHRAEALILMAIALVLPALVFTGLLDPTGIANPLVFVAIALWPAFRSTPVMTSTVLTMLATVSLAAVATGASPIVLPIDNLFAIGISVTGGSFLVLAAQATVYDRVQAHARERRRADGLAVAVEHESQAARDAARRRDAIFSHALEGIITVDDNMHIVEANRAAQELLGADAYDLAGSSLEDVLPGCRLSVRTGQQRFEGLIHDRLPVEVSWTKWSLGGNVFHTAFIRDMTERMEAEQRRREAAEAERALASMAEQAAFRTEFLNHAAHEIRTPMTPLLLQVSILRHLEKQMPGNAAHAVSAIQRNLTRLKRILDDMLDVGRFQAGHLEVNREELDILPLVRQVVHDHQPVMDAKGITMQVKLPERARVHGDADRVHQILANLLSNAEKYTPEGGHVDVEVRHRLGAVEVQVRDSGLGMDADQLGRLFQPFSRVHDDLPIPGTGLGLYVSQSLARLHQGDLVAASDGPGKGACFTLRLPAPDTLAKNVQYSDSSPGLATTSGRGKP